MTTPTLATLARGSFAGHETFPLRYTTLRKAVQLVERDPGSFGDDDAMVRLGVGKRMFGSMRHWALACHVLEERPAIPGGRGRVLRPTALGHALFGDDGWDPFLEDPATPWILHHELASRPERATTLYLAFNHLLQAAFSREELLRWLWNLAQERSWARVSPASLGHDVDVFLRMYARASRAAQLEDALDCPLVELELIREVGAKDSYLLQRGPSPSLPDAVFAYGLVRFLAHSAPASGAVPLCAIASAPGSPGCVFALAEDALMARLERIEATTGGGLVFREVAGSRQLQIHRMPEALDVLRPWFEGRGARERQPPAPPAASAAALVTGGDALERDALEQVDAASSLAQRLARVAPPRPLIARRHLCETGTLRYFELRYVDVSAFERSFPAIAPDADGGVLLVIEPDDSRRTKLLHKLEQPGMWAAAGPRPVLVAVPRHVERLLEVGADLVARLLDGGVACDWFTDGGQHPATSSRALAGLLSDLCDAAYARAPIVQHALLNRRQLSSTAAAARRSLLEAMVTHPAEPQLGLDGATPEVSMYRALLEHHGLHREREGSLGFGAPGDRERGSLCPTWIEIEQALNEAQEARLSVPLLFERLRRPPYGLKDGLLPVLLVAAMLAWKDEVALYEDGAFVPALTGAVIERLLRAPARFEVQRLAITGARAALYHRLLRLLSTGVEAPLSGLVPVVRQLLRMTGDLTDFARTTRTISPRAQAVREALLRAQEPAPLLFRELPVACGTPPFEAEAAPSEDAVDAFVEGLRGALRELQLAYPNLLDAIEEAIRAGLGLPGDPSELRRELGDRAERLVPVAFDTQLKAFLLRASDKALPRQEWLISLGTLLAGKPPEAWHDRDMDQMRMELRLMCRRFASLEAVVIGPETTPLPDAPQLLRIAVSQPGQIEQERVVPLRSADQALVSSVCSQLRAVAGGAGASLPREAIVAALGLVARDIIAELNGAA